MSGLGSEAERGQSFSRLPPGKRHVCQVHGDVCSARTLRLKIWPQHTLGPVCQQTEKMGLDSLTLSKNFKHSPTLTTQKRGRPAATCVYAPVGKSTSTVALPGPERLNNMG